MRYTQMLNQRLKNAGREYARSRGAEKAEDLSKAIRTARREAEDTDSFSPGQRRRRALTGAEKRNS